MVAIVDNSPDDVDGVCALLDALGAELVAVGAAGGVLVQDVGREQGGEVGAVHAVAGQPLARGGQPPVVGVARHLPEERHQRLQRVPVRRRQQLNQVLQRLRLQSPVADFCEKNSREVSEQSAIRNRQM